MSATVIVGKLSVVMPAVVAVVAVFFTAETSRREQPTESLISS
ncbi:hypothetical protein [Paeniglutamicibacter sp. Y32M11]|nr:hypothetical protein [Paeniglutamicibacter sp. Y32M11]